MSWRIVHTKHRMPAPGELLGITALFAAGALVADIYPTAGGFIVVTLFGLDVAAFLDVLPQGLGKQITQAETAQAGASGNVPGAAAEGSGGPLNG